jgi:predicted acyltransferase
VTIASSDGQQTIRQLAYRRITAVVGAPEAASLVYALIGLLLLFGLLAWMHRRRIFIRL